MNQTNENNSKNETIVDDIELISNLKIKEEESETIEHDIDPPEEKDTSQEFLYSSEQDVEIIQFNPKSCTLVENYESNELPWIGTNDRNHTIITPEKCNVVSCGETSVSVYTQGNTQGDQGENDMLSLSPVDSFGFVNDSLQIDDSLDKDGGTRFKSKNAADGLFPINVVVNGHSPQQDIVTMNPIEADSLLFIEDSLQVD